MRKYSVPALFLFFAGMCFSFTGCMGTKSEAPKSKTDSVKTENKAGKILSKHKKPKAPEPDRIVHIISAEPYPQDAGASAMSVDLAYQDTTRTLDFEFLREDKRPCEFQPGEATLVFEKDVPPRILPNAICQDTGFLP